MTLYLVIAILSFVQSLFGVGLLVFGTPILLMLGYSFVSALTYLLPCSLAISAVQVLHGWHDIGTFKKNVVVYMLPLVVLGLLLAFKLELHGYNMKPYMGGMLLTIGVTRLSKGLHDKIGQFFHQYLKLALALIGMIHGMTNLGGGPLAIMANAIFAEKKAIRANIACAYLFMALSQMVTLCFLGKFVVSGELIILPCLSLFIYLSLGNYTFHTAGRAVYYHAMTLVVLLFGITLMAS